MQELDEALGAQAPRGLQRAHRETVEGPLEENFPELKYVNVEITAL